MVLLKNIYFESSPYDSEAQLGLGTTGVCNKHCLGVEAQVWNKPEVALPLSSEFFTLRNISGNELNFVEILMCFTFIYTHAHAPVVEKL